MTHVQFVTVSELTMIKSVSDFSRFFSLRLALIVYVVIPLAGAMVITGYLALGALERSVEQRMQKDLELVARAIQLPLSHALELDREGSMSRALESAFSIGRVYSAYVYDLGGRQIAFAGRSEPEPSAEKMSELAADGRELGEYGRVAGRSVYSYFVPLTDSGGRINGLLHLTRRQSDFRDDIQKIRTQGLTWLGVGFLVMSGLVLYGHHRALGKYFSSLMISMSRVAKGETGHRLKPGGPREVAAIGLRFNHMLDSMESARSELRERRAKQEFLQLRLRQSEKLAAIGQLSAGIAHELGTPLSVISGKAQRALRKEDLDEDSSSAFREIRREVVRMEYIIRQLLDFSRRGEVRRQPVTLSRVARLSVAAVEEEAARHGVELELAGKEMDSLIRLDPLRMEQALVNLLRNGVHAAGGGKVVLSWGQEGRRAWFQVDDSGPGIPSEIRSRLFEPFFTTKSVGSGTGLGLAVVHGIVREHDGEIEFGDSRLGGAYFRIRLAPGQEVSEEPGNE